MPPIAWTSIGHAATSLAALALAENHLQELIDRTRTYKREYSLTLRTATSQDAQEHIVYASAIRKGTHDSCKLTYSPTALWYVHTHPCVREPCVRMPSPTDLETHLHYDGYDAYSLVLNCDPRYSTACIFTARPHARVPQPDEWSEPLDYVLRTDREREAFLRDPWKNIELNERIVKHMGRWGFPATIRPFKGNVGSRIALPDNDDLLAERIMAENCW